jgi:hypothetical protein
VLAVPGGLPMTDEEQPRWGRLGRNR